MKLQNLIQILILIACIGFLSKAHAVGPDTDGNIPGSNNGEGIGVLVSRTTGVWNTGTGFEALNHLTAGNQNTATGLRALFSDTNGGFNTATGVYSLFSNTSGFFNSATGAYSLANNTTGIDNTANGYGSLYYNTEGAVNTANGYAALYRNTTGSANTADGAFALFSDTTGDHNTATGADALSDNTEGAFNTANGYGTLGNNITGGSNVAIGSQALHSNITGFQNTAVGAAALFNNTAGTANIAVGINAGIGVTTVENVICIGADGANVTNSCYIGQIFGRTSSGGTAVFINSDGKLGTTTSSRRFKEEIQPMEGASEALLALKPVIFRYKKDVDPHGIPQFGLVAEDVEAVNPDLVVRDGEGKVNTVRYDAVNAMLLNEFLKDHRKNEEQEATIARQQKQIEALTEGLQKVSAQLEVSKPTMRVVAK
jgi:hypothetical protein